VTDQQRTPEWYAARVGKITGSRFGSVMALGAKGQPLQARKQLLQTLALERLTGQAEEIETNTAMQHGIDTEPLAKQWFTFAHDLEIIEHGLVVDAQHPFIAVSPDGSIVGDIGTAGELPIKAGIEIKCPVSKRIHMDRLTNGTPENLASGRWEIDHDHYWQMQGQCMVMGWDMVYYVSFHPGMPAGLQGHVIPVAHNTEDTKRLREQCVIVDAEVNVIVAALRSKIQC
jgi:putative phage-type endonuclease